MFQSVLLQGIIQTFQIIFLCKNEWNKHFFIWPTMFKSDVFYLGLQLQMIRFY
jgi:hypothetical protein